MSGEPDLLSLSGEVELPDEAVHNITVSRARGLGRLAELAGWLAAVQGASPPSPPELTRLVAVSGDHPLGASVSSRTGPLPEIVTDEGVALREIPLAGMAQGDRAAALAAFDAGRTVADQEADGGTELLLVVCRGHGCTTVAAALTCLLTNTDVATVTGRDLGIDDNTWMDKATIVRDLVRESRPHLGDPFALLAAIGSDVAAFTAGLLLQAAIRRTPVIIDGALTPACGLVAQRLAYRAPLWWQIADTSAETGHTAALDRLDRRAVLDLRTNRDDGFAAVLVARTLAAAVAAID